MNSDGNYYHGGGTHGAGVYYKFWTSRDFASVPANTYGVRWTFAGTYAIPQTDNFYTPFGYYAVLSDIAHFSTITGKWLYLYYDTPSGWVVAVYV